MLLSRRRRWPPSAAPRAHAPSPAKRPRSVSRIPGQGCIGNCINITLVVDGSALCLDYVGEALRHALHEAGGRARHPGARAIKNTPLARNSRHSSPLGGARAAARWAAVRVWADARGRRMHAHGVLSARFRRGGARNEDYDFIEGSTKLCFSRAVEVGHRAPPPEPMRRPQPTAAEACRE